MNLVIDRLIRQRGLSLVELMVSLVVGLLLTAGVMQVFVSNKQTYALNDDLAMMQESARYAMSFIGEDIRMAGFAGCSSSGPVANTLKDADKADFGDFGLGINGIDGDEADFATSVFDVPAVPPLASGSFPASDALMIFRADTASQSFTVTGHVTASAIISVDSAHGFASGKILYITDCDHAAVFKTTSTQTEKIQHNAGGNGNECKGLGLSGGEACNTGTAVGTTYQYQEDAVVMEATSRGYFVNDDSGIPSLFRRELQTTTFSAEELVPGIENFQVAYGLDIDDSGVANRYISAETITDPQWLKVVSAKVWLLVRSLNQVASKPTDFTFKGANYTPTDRYLRKEFVMTVKLRNRGES